MLKLGPFHSMQSLTGGFPDAWSGLYQICALSTLLFFFWALVSQVSDLHNVREPLPNYSWPFSPLSSMNLLHVGIHPSILFHEDLSWHKTQLDSNFKIFSHKFQLWSRFQMILLTQKRILRSYLKYNLLKNHVREIKLEAY